MNRRFLPALGVTLLFLAGGWPFFTLGFINHYSSADSDWVEMLYQRKDWAMRQSSEKPGPRLIVVGGSGALYGVDAELIQQKLGVPTINYATHAGLYGYLFYRARRVLRPGDSVLLCPEYELWNANDISTTEWEYVTTYDKRFVWSLGTVPSIKTLYDVPGASYFQSLLGWRSRLMGMGTGPQWGYNVANLATMDASGDLRRPLHHTPFPLPQPPLLPDVSNDDPAFGGLRDFASWAKANHVRVFYSWPNCCRPERWSAADDRMPPAIQELLDAWGFICLNQPGETLFPRQWFLDTEYHLDAGGRRVRTEALVRRLRPYYGLPDAGALPRGIYLVTSNTWWLRPGNAFADRPDVRAKYLTPGRLDCPDDITPGELPAWCARGVPIYFDDPAVEQILSANAWEFREVDRDRESLGDWLKRYSHHLFLLARAGGTKPKRTLPPANGLPPEVQSALELPGNAVAVVGTGAWRNATRLLTGKHATIKASLEQLAGRRAIHLAVEASSAGNHSAIRVNIRPYAESSDGGICAVVIEPLEGIVVDFATFRNGGAQTLWSMKQLLPRTPSATRPSR